MPGPTPEFWQSRFLEGDMPWDRGEPNPHLAVWIEAGILPAGATVIVPGCGQGWEVVFLAERGFRVIGIDLAPAALALCRRRLEQRGLAAELIVADVLSWQPARPAEAIYEQTCLCALYPDHWRRYADQLYRWLAPGGTLLALFMQAPRAEDEEGIIVGPPYHCPITAMRALFPAERWEWPKPPYPRVENERIERHELAAALLRR